MKEYRIFLISFALERHIYISVTITCIYLLKLYPRCMESVVCNGLATCPGRSIPAQTGSSLLSPLVG